MSTKTDYKKIAEQIIEVVHKEGIIFSSLGELGKYFDLSTSRHDVEEYVREITNNYGEDDEVFMRGITSKTEGTFYLFYNAKRLNEKYPDVDNLEEIINIEAIKQLKFKKEDII